VERLWEELRRQGKDARAFARATIAVVGPGTASALERVGLVPDLVAKDSKGEGLAGELAQVLRGVEAARRPRILLARAEVARSVLPEALREVGCEVDDVAVYRTEAAPRPLLEGIRTLLDSEEIDVVTFTSSSTVTHLCDALGPRASTLLAKACVASIGPVTSETARQRGVRVDVTAEEHTVPGLVAALEEHLRGPS
jgi:uroporphyrinogen III methyltransferase/synthase